MHRAAKGRHWNICARLILFGANKQLLNADSKKPFQYLTAADQQKVTDLQNTLSILIGQLHQSAPAILQTRLFIDNSSLPDNDKRRKAFDELYQIPEIQPLLDLAKLAALGLHDLSDPKNERKKFVDADYDSDDDDNERLSENQKLSFRFDSKKPTVNGMIHYGHDGEEGEGSYGVYLPKTNIIYYGAQRNKVDEVRATMIHELTHFIAYEVFKNDCKPFSNQSPEQATLEAIKNDLRSRKVSLDPILALAFNKDYEVAQQSDAELIVRVPQMLAEYGVIVGLQKLQQQAPNLLNYYKNTFLSAVKAHCDKLEKRALRAWPKDLFMKSRTTEYMPQLNGI